MFGKKGILYISTKPEEAQILRNLDTPKDPEHDVFDDDNLK